MFNVDVVVLLSYDQMQFSDNNRLSVFYWTIVGGYLVNGSQYDVSTLVDASVFDVASRQLLFRAPGTSQLKGRLAAGQVWRGIPRGSHRRLPPGRRCAHPQPRRPAWKPSGSG